MPIEQLLQLIKQDWESDSTLNPELTRLTNQYWDNSTMQERYQLFVGFYRVIGFREEDIWSYERFCKEEDNARIRETVRELIADERERLFEFVANN